MNYTVFDVETTGLGGKAEVVQFSALLLNDDLKIQKVYNTYCYTQVAFQEEAAAVTGLDHEKLMKLSKGKFFEDFYCSSDLFKLKDNIWCGYNGVFDKRIINNTLTQNGLQPHDFGTEIARFNKTSGVYYFDVMKLNCLVKKISYNEKLSQCAKALPYSQQKLDLMYAKLLKIVKSDTEITFHNALYDSMITWLYLDANRRWCC